ncbi:MAG: hypothetical protein ACKO23_04145, partial [Gemmataceae bacterium]
INVSSNTGALRNSGRTKFVITFGIGTDNRCWTGNGRTPNIESKDGDLMLTAPAEIRECIIG